MLQLTSQGSVTPAISCPEQAADCTGRVEATEHFDAHTLMPGCMCHVLNGVWFVMGYGIGKLATMCEITSCCSGK